ncbi:MAG: hypothetical protein IJJ51_01005 [Kiritimatiellae bacterium]|nr:hypothetical protein [Kiritimatiellia bacterium]
MTDYCNTQAVTIPEGTPRYAAFAFASDLGRCLHDLEIDINKAMAALERYDSDDYADGFGQGVSVALALRDAKADLGRWQKRKDALEIAASDLPCPAPKPPTTHTPSRSTRISATACCRPTCPTPCPPTADAKHEGDEK